MKHLLLSVLVLAVMVLSMGCTGKKIVQANTEPRNQIIMEMVGTGEQLTRRGQISMHKVYPREDDVKIDVWVINAAPGPARATAILLHGLGQSKANYIGIGRNLAKRQYDVVLIDLRCHGRSTAQYITCGAKEKQDVQAIVDDLAAAGKIKPAPLYVFGVTFGGATAIQYAAIEPDVKGVVALAPWKDTYSKARRDMGMMMDDAEFNAALDEAGKLADFDPHETSAISDARDLQIPVYLIHGMLDLAVPVADSEAIFQALPYGQKRLRIINPGPEQMAVGIGWETWVPDQIDAVRNGSFLQKDKSDKPSHDDDEPAENEPADTDEVPTTAPPPTTPDAS
jgi:pimeloyl-ACP methyl ester carboxylesterase